MKKDVIISIYSSPKYENEQEPEAMELITNGRFYKKNGIYYVVYKESALTGLDGVTTTLKVEPTKVTLIRNGTYTSQMLFEQGEKHVGLYDTGNGALTVSIYANRIDNSLSDEGGNLMIDYSIEINNTLAGENTLSATVKESYATNAT